MDKRKLAVISILVIFLTGLASAHAFSLPDWSEEDNSDFTPSEEFFNSGENVEKSMKSMFVLGIEHILDSGSKFFSVSTPFVNDHGYLLIGLMLIPGYLASMKLKDAIKIGELASAFAVGHGIAIFSVYLNLVSIPSYIVESGIAFSIFLIGLDRLAIIEEVKDYDVRTDLIILAVTGFWHGNGFSAVVENVGFTSHAEAVKYLLTFTLGVDVGQFVFLIVAGGVLAFLVSRFEEKKVLKSFTLVLMIVGLMLTVFRFLPVVGGIL